MKVFLDTNVLVSAFASRGICADLLELVLLEHDLIVGHNVLRELDRRGTQTLETGMWHWNMWPVVGYFFLWKASGRDEHRALFE